MNSTKSTAAAKDAEKQAQIERIRAEIKKLHGLLTDAWIKSTISRQGDYLFVPGIELGIIAIPDSSDPIAITMLVWNFDPSFKPLHCSKAEEAFDYVKALWKPEGMKLPDGSIMAERLFSQKKEKTTNESI